MTDVFISYASSSRESAAWVARAVEGLGYSVWWDSALLPHDMWGTTIEQELNAARCVVVLWSSDALGSRWVRAEATRALDSAKLIQASLDGASPPMPFDQIQFVTLDDWEGEKDHPGWLRIAASLKHILSGERIAADLPPVRARPHGAAPMQTLTLGGVLRAVPGWLAVAIITSAVVSLLPLLLGKWVLPPPLAFLASPMSSLLLVVLMAGLLLFLPRLPRKLLTAFLVGSIVLALGAGIAHARLTDRFVRDAPWNGESTLLGCGVPQQTCQALADNGLGCESPAAMCPLEQGQNLEGIIENYGYDPAQLYGDGIDQVKDWLWLAWNGLFLGIALFAATVLAQALKPQLRRLMHQGGR